MATAPFDSDDDTDDFLGFTQQDIDTITTKNEESDISVDESIDSGKETLNPPRNR